MSETKRTDPKLWKKIVYNVKKGTKGGLSGQWSARKAQLAVSMYKKQGGKYKNRKSKNNSLVRWTKQKWRTRSGKPSLVTGERYLPDKVIKKLSKKEYVRTSSAKRRSVKQYSRQPKDIARKTSKIISKSRSRRSRK